MTKTKTKKKGPSLSIVDLASDPDIKKILAGILEEDKK